MALRFTGSAGVPRNFGRGRGNISPASQIIDSSPIPVVAGTTTITITPTELAAKMYRVISLEISCRGQNAGSGTITLKINTVTKKTWSVDSTYRNFYYTYYIDDYAQSVVIELVGNASTVVDTVLVEARTMVVTR